MHWYEHASFVMNMFVWCLVLSMDVYMILGLPWLSYCLDLLLPLFEMNGMIGFHMLGFFILFYLFFMSVWFWLSLFKGRYVSVLGLMMPWLYA